MKYTLYEDPLTHRFAMISVPDRFVAGDKLPIPPATQWFSTREDAIESLRDLFNRDE